MKCNKKFGFAPFTRACFKNKNVRHEVGQRKKNEDVGKITGECYKAKRELKDQGFRIEGIFDDQIVSAITVEKRQQEYKKTTMLLRRGGLYLIYTPILEVCACQICR